MTFFRCDLFTCYFCDLGVFSQVVFTYFFVKVALGAKLSPTDQGVSGLKKFTTRLNQIGAEK